MSLLDRWAKMKWDYDSWEDIKEHVLSNGVSVKDYLDDMESLAEFKEVQK